MTGTETEANFTKEIMPVMIDIFGQDPDEAVASGAPMEVKTTRDYVNSWDEEMTDHCHIDAQIW